MPFRSHSLPPHSHPSLLHSFQNIYLFHKYSLISSLCKRHPLLAAGSAHPTARAWPRVLSLPHSQSISAVHYASASSPVKHSSNKTYLIGLLSGLNNNSWKAFRLQWASCNYTIYGNLAPFLLLLIIVMVIFPGVMHTEGHEEVQSLL